MIHQALHTMLRALRHRNFRLFFIGQGISLIGTWMTRLTTGWLVWRLTHSPEMLGLLGFFAHIPTFLIAPFAGVWADRINRHRLLTATQILAMLQSLTLAVLTLSDVVLVWEVFALQAIQGVINAFDMPSRQALMVDLVEERADLPNAIALNSSMFNAARLVGPSVAGILIAWVGEGWCFLIDGISYVAVIASLLIMRISVHRPAARKKRVVHELIDGLHYVNGFTPIRAILLLLALVGLVGMPYTVLLPIIVTHSLQGGPHTLGFLMGSMGVGALLGALYLASRKSVLGLGRLIPLASATFGMGLVILGLSHSQMLSMIVMALSGVGFMIHMAASNTLLQTLVRDDMRGRVMALFGMAFMGMSPFGSLLAGAVAARIGAAETVMACGLICLCGAAIFSRKLPALRELVRPVYIERGILPEMAKGLEGANNVRDEAG